MRIDSTYGNVNFAYTDPAKQVKTVTTLEEEEYPNYYNKTACEGKSGTPDPDVLTKPATVTPPVECVLQEKHLTFQENQKGISFDVLLGKYLEGARNIVITDPYIRMSA